MPSFNVTVTVRGISKRESRKPKSKRKWAEMDTVQSDGWNARRRKNIGWRKTTLAIGDADEDPDAGERHHWQRHLNTVWTPSERASKGPMEAREAMRGIRTTQANDKSVGWGCGLVIWRQNILLAFSGRTPQHQIQTRNQVHKEGHTKTMRKLVLICFLGDLSGDPFSHKISHWLRTHTAELATIFLRDKPN